MPPRAFSSTAQKMSKSEISFAALEQEPADCYVNTLDLCAENKLRSVAFCCISTGVFHFPNGRAAEIAVQTAADWLAAHGGQMERVIFNVFKDEDRKLYEKLLARGGMV